MAKLLKLFLLLFAISVSLPAFAATELETKLTALSNSGNGEADYHLGMLYHVGLAGVQKDAAKAFLLFRRSAERGDPLGAYKLGCYYDGQGKGVVKADPELALKFKLIAAEAGYGLAQQDVARHLIAQGDIEGGMRWLETSAAQGDLMALMTLGGIYSDQLPKEMQWRSPDPVKSFTYLLIGARDMPDIRKGMEADGRTKLSKVDYERAMAIAEAWRAKPSALNQKADLGLNAAYSLTGLPMPKLIPLDPLQDRHRGHQQPDDDQ